MRPPPLPQVCRDIQSIEPEGQERGRKKGEGSSEKVENEARGVHKREKHGQRAKEEEKGRVED